MQVGDSLGWSIDQSGSTSFKNIYNKIKTYIALQFIW